MDQAAVQRLTQEVAQQVINWGIPSSDGIPYGLAGFFFPSSSSSFSVSFRRQIWRSWWPNTIKETLYMY